MKVLRTKITLAVLFCLVSLVLFSVSGYAEEIAAEGKINEEIDYKIYNIGSADKPRYTLKINGKGTFYGITDGGEKLTYKTRESTVFAPYAENLVYAEIGEGIERITDYALAFLPALREVLIPESLTEIGSAAFQSCGELVRIYTERDKDIEGFALRNIEKLGNWSFSGCRSVEHIYFSDSLAGRIGTETFGECRSLKNITIPTDVTAIGEKCFKNCTSLIYVKASGNPTFEKSALDGAYGAYILCPKDSILFDALKENGLPYGGEDPKDIPIASLDSVDYGVAGQGLYWYITKNEAFTADSPKYDLHITGEGDTVKIVTKQGRTVGYNTYHLSPWASYREAIVTAEIESDVTELSSGSFIGLENLESVCIPHSLTSIGTAAFEHCKKLESVYLVGDQPRSGVFDMSRVKFIGNYCFDGCGEMTEIILNDAMEQTFIGTETFKNCKGLKTFVVPEAVKKIEKNAFLGCEGLTEVIFEKDASIDRRAFEGCSNLNSFRGFTGSEAESFAKEQGIAFLYPCKVAVRLVGSKRLIENIEVVAGQAIEHAEFDGAVCLLYTDPDGKKPFDMNTGISETTTLYAEPVFRVNEPSVRADGELGMRVDFSFASKEGNSLYSIESANVIVSKNRGASDALLTRDMNFTEIFELLASDLYTELPMSGRNMSLCAVGYENDGKYLYDRFDERLYFRGYTVLRNRETGDESIFYTEMKSASMRELISEALGGEAHGYDRKELDAIRRIAAELPAEKSPRAKNELIAMAESIAGGSMETLLAGSPELSEKSFFTDFLANEYNKNGDVPSLVRFDATEAYSVLGDDAESIRALASEISKYAELGGSVMLYIRPSKPGSENSLGGRLGANEWENLFKKGTPGNSSLLYELGKPGMLLQFLKELDVSVYACPIPEISSKYRWWSNISGEDGDIEETYGRYKKLWQLTREYLEEDCALDNIVWVYEGGEDGDNYYPGEEYADIFGSGFESSKGKVTLEQIKGVID